MGDYNFQGLNPREFEHLVQALTKKILGNGSITFGDGTDGGREATFEGKGFFHSLLESWEGYWVIQAKFKQRDSVEDNYQWIKTNFESEMAKFAKFKSEGKENLVPNNYLFFTNVVLTPVLEKGMLDKIDQLIKSNCTLIPNISIVGYDDLCKLLDNNRDVATAYSSFIRSGDILEQAFKYFQDKNASVNDHTESLLRFLHKEFAADLHSQLRQAGDNTGDKINLEDVFIDLYAVNESDSRRNEKRHPKFLQSSIYKGDSMLRPLSDNNKSPNDRSLGYILIGDAGYGKSTLTQFLSQTYRAFFLHNNINNFNSAHVEQFINQFQSLEIPNPKCNRFPFKIVLKDYAGWSIENKKKQESFSILTYFQHRLRVVADIEISIEEIRNLLKNLSFLFIFDGLDEVPATSNREDILKEINHYVEVEITNNNCDALVIATTRPQGYNNDFNRMSLEKIQLVPLSVNECQNYIIKIVSKFSDDPDQVSELTRILFKALEDDTVSKLMETPLQATIMTFLVRMGGEPPRNKFDLFSNYIDTMITREQQKGVLEIISDLSHHIKIIHNNLGYYLHKGSGEEDNPSSSMSEERFLEYIHNYLLDELGYEEDSVKIYASNIMDAIEGRLAFITKTTDTSVGFCVRSLQEYFAAMYLMTHRSDEEMRDSLNNISSSAYWRKPFLFAVGFLTRQRKDMLGYVIEICREMNGEDVEIAKENVKSIAVLGSWLALDILNDGVLSTYPKYENMLSRLLEELFTISHQQSHGYLGNLPQSVIQKTVIPIINKYMPSVNINIKLTTITILFYILNSKGAPIKELIHTLEKNWPNENEEVIIKYLLGVGFENEWFINKTIQSMKHNKNKFIYLEDITLGYGIERIIAIGSSDVEIKWIILNNLFLKYLTNNSRHKDYEFLIRQTIQYEKLVKENHQYNNYLFRDNLSLKIYNDYEAAGHSVFSNDKELFIFIIDNLSTFNSKDCFIYAYSNFVIEPNSNNLFLLFEELHKEDKIVFNSIRSRRHQINWLLGKILDDVHEIEQIPIVLKNIKEGKYGEVDEWGKFETEIKGSEELAVYALPSLKMRRVIEDAEHFCEMFYYFCNDVTYNSKEEEFIMEKELLRAFSHIEIKSDNINLFTDDMLDTILKILLKADGITNFIIYGVLHRLILLMKPQNILSLILENKHFEIDLVQHHHHLFMENDQLIGVFQKNSDILLPLKIESTLIRMLPSILFSLEPRNIPELSKVNFKYIQDVKYEDNKNETCRVLLCLLDHILNMNNPKVSELIVIHYTNEPELLEYIINIFDICKVNIDSIEAIFMDIYNLIEKNNMNSYRLSSRYEEFLKDAYERVLESS